MRWPGEVKTPEVGPHPEGLKAETGEIDRPPEDLGNADEGKEAIFATHDIYYDQGTDIKAKQGKTLVTFDTIPESNILDAGDLLILSKLQKPWTIACKDISRVFEIEYSTYRILIDWNYVNARSPLVTTY